MTDLSIIIVSWNVAPLLIACLRSIEAHRANLALEVIVVDSASTDDSVAQVRANFPQVKLLPQTENVGFVRGNNIGLAHANGRHLLLLNPDTEVTAGMLPSMVRYLDEHPAIGIIGAHTYNTDGSTQSSKRRFPTLAIAFLESTWLQPYAPAALLRHYYAQDIPDDTTAEVDWVQGHALMARREVYAQIGGLDPIFIMYSEELDWCYRAKQNGWGVVYLASAHVIHHGGKSSEQASAYTLTHFNRSKVRYIQKVYGRGVALVLRLYLLSGFALQLLIEALKGLLRHKPALRRQRVSTYWQVIRSGL